MNIEIKNISKRFGSQVIYKDFSAMIPEGKITGISGPSGIGKTTLLKMLAGLEQPDSGRILGLPKKGCVSCVFQDDRLLPWMTVRQNIEFVLTLDEERQRIDEILSLVSLQNHGNQLVSTLSGGQMKRVAFARAFCKKSRLLLMDEPFTGLDEVLKAQIIADFLKLLISESPQRTVVIVSHDKKLLKEICDEMITLD